MKRLLTLIMALTMLLSLAVPVSAAGDEAEEAAEALYELGLFNGTGADGNGNPVFDLDRTPNRAEGITMLVRLLGKEEEAKAGTWTTPFVDVPDWAAPYVGYAYTNGLTTGNGGDGTTYGSDDLMSAAQYITFVLRSLGYTSGTDFQWDTPWTLSDTIGLTHGEYGAETASFTRGDVAILSYRSLSVHQTVPETVPVSGVTLNKAALALDVGESAQLTAVVTPENATDKSVAWLSSNAAVVTVENGLVTAVGYGTASVTATVAGGVSAACSVTVSPLGTLANPMPSDGSWSIQFNEYSFTPVREVVIELRDEVRGADANAIAQSENMFNTKPNSNQEWRFFEFYLTYLSSSAGPSDRLQASEIIFTDTFYTASGARVQGELATLGKDFDGYGVFDVSLYPGAGSTVIIGILVPKNVGDLLLNVPIDKGQDVVWVDLGASASGNGQNAGDSYSGSEGTSPSAPSAAVYAEYPTVPDFGAMIGADVYYKFTDESGAMYFYTLTSIEKTGYGSDSITMYDELLSSCGFRYLGSDYDSDGNKVMFYTNNVCGVGISLSKMNGVPVFSVAVIPD